MVRMTIVLPEGVWLGLRRWSEAERVSGRPAMGKLIGKILEEALDQRGTPVMQG